MAKFRGEIVEISPQTGALVVTESWIDPDWPTGIDPLGRGNAVYLALPDSFIPDPYREPASPEERALMIQLARDHEREAGIRPSCTVLILEPAGPDDDLIAPDN